jgi:hypothetical protein
MASKSGLQLLTEQEYREKSRLCCGAGGESVPLLYLQLRLTQPIELLETEQDEGDEGKKTIKKVESERWTGDGDEDGGSLNRMCNRRSIRCAVELDRGVRPLSFFLRRRSANPSRIANCEWGR